MTKETYYCDRCDEARDFFPDEEISLGLPHEGCGGAWRCPDGAAETIRAAIPVLRSPTKSHFQAMQDVEDALSFLTKKAKS